MKRVLLLYAKVHQGRVLLGATLTFSLGFEVKP